LKYVKTYKVFEHQGTGDRQGEDDKLYKIRHFQGNLEDFKEFIKQKEKETK